MPETSETTRILETTSRYGADNYAPLPVVISQADGVWVTDVDGKRYLDCLSAYSAVNQGHRHPRLLAAAVAQLERVTLTSRAFHNDQLGPLAEELCRLSGFGKMLPMNTGAEAVETAIKMARRWGYEQKGIPDGEAEIVVCDGNFHGRTTTIVGFSTEEAYRRGFGPFTPGFLSVPFGDIGAMAQAVGPNTAALLVEPIQGEGGVLVPPEGYLEELRRLCTQERLLLMFDEIQVGLGRTGRLFCHQHEEARPDVLILGKALAGGVYPVSAVLADEPVMSVFRPGDHGSTFGGNPLGCAVAREALRILIDEGLAERADELGRHLRSRLRQIPTDKIREVRGKGLLVGVQLTPAAGNARPYCERLMDLGMLCKETHEDVIRIAPPLVIERADLHWAVERMAEVLA